MTDLKSEKAQVRKDVREQLHRAAAEEVAEWSATITDRLIALPEYRQAQAIMVFLSFTREYDTGPLTALALKAGKTVCAPKVDWATLKMSPVKMNHPGEFVRDEHGVKDPTGDEPVSVDLLDLVLVPGLAFDVYGRRLGRGAGFYDHFLARADLRAFRLAPTFDFQVRPEIPFGPGDEPMDMILTPTRTLRFVR